MERLSLELASSFRLGFLVCLILWIQIRTQLNKNLDDKSDLDLDSNVQIATNIF